MGEVKEEIKGTPAPKKANPPGTGNLLDQVRTMTDELSRLTAIKDDDVAKEGDNLKAENLRKAGVLRAVTSMMRTVSYLLESY